MNNIFIEDEYRKCIASPYYFATNYLTISRDGGVKSKFTTLLSEDEFNKQFNESATDSCHLQTADGRKMNVEIEFFLKGKLLGRYLCPERSSAEERDNIAIAYDVGEYDKYTLDGDRVVVWREGLIWRFYNSEGTEGAFLLHEEKEF